MRILAVCAGNICRSPAAEAAIVQAAGRAGLDIEVDSAGTGSWHIGQPPHDESVAAGRRAGLEIEGRARKVTVADFDRFDVIVAMDRANLADLNALAPSAAARAKVRLFRTFDPATDEDEIPDPWGGPSEGYDETIRLVTAAAEGLVLTLAATRA
jgi:protein-tyrosine phosphatase